MPVAYNESTGEALRLDDGGKWVKTIVAENPQTGERLALDGSSWASVGKPKQSSAPPPEKKASYSEGFMASVNPLGLGDEVGAAGATVGQWLGSKVNPEKMPFPGWGAAYDANIAAERKKISDFRDDNPVAGYGGAVIGSMGGRLPATGIGPSAAANSMSKIPVVGPKIAAMMEAPTAATMAGRAAQSARVGAGLGGLYGFTEGEGGVAGRLGSAATGAAVGGGIGTAAVPLIEGGVAGAQKLYRALADKFGSSDSAAVRKIVEAMRRDGMTADEIAANLRANPNAALMDAGGENMTALASAAGTVPGPSKNVAQKFVDERMGGRGQRMVGSVDRNLAPSNELYSTIEDLSAKRAQTAAPLYEAAYSSGPIHSDRIAQMLEDPIMKKGLAQGLEIQRIESTAAGKPFNPVDYAITGFNEAGDPIIGGVPNMRTLDAVKKGLDNILDGYRDGATGKLNLDQKGVAIDKLRRTFLEQIDAINPEYKAARAAWAGPSADIAAAKLGRSFVNKDEEVTAKVMAAMSDSEKEAFRIGAARALKDMIASNTNGAAQKFADSRSLLWDRLKPVFPDQASFQAFKKSMEQELKMQQNERFVSSRIGSPTAIKNLAVEDMRNDPGAIIQGGRQIAGGDKIGGLMNVGRGVMDYLRRPSEAVAGDLASKMYTADAATNQATLKAMTEKLRQLQIADKAKQSAADLGARVGILGYQGQ
jgi:hypothetical protein